MPGKSKVNYLCHKYNRLPVAARCQLLRLLATAIRGIRRRPDKIGFPLGPVPKHLLKLFRYRQVRKCRIEAGIESLGCAVMFRWSGSVTCYRAEISGSFATRVTMKACRASAASSFEPSVSRTARSSCIAACAPSPLKSALSRSVDCSESPDSQAFGQSACTSQTHRATARSSPSCSCPDRVALVAVPSPPSR